jgi:hypothetical protein
MPKILNIRSSFDITPGVWLYFLKNNQVIFKEVFSCSNPISPDHLDFRIVKNQLFSQLLNLENNHLLLMFLIHKIDFGPEYSTKNLKKVKEYIFDLFKFNAKHSEIRNFDKQEITDDSKNIEKNKVIFAIIEKLIEFNQDDIVKNIRYFCYNFRSRDNIHTLKRTTNPLDITANVSEIIKFYSQGDSQFKEMEKLKLTPSALNFDRNTSLAQRLKTRILSVYERPHPSPQLIDVDSDSKTSNRIAYEVSIRSTFKPR